MHKHAVQAGRRLPPRRCNPDRSDAKGTLALRRGPGRKGEGQRQEGGGNENKKKGKRRKGKEAEDEENSIPCSLRTYCEGFS